jgi:Rrf2 family protein
MAGIVNMSEAVSLGIHAMMVLAAFPEENWTTRSIATELEVSENHLAKVMQRLSKTGLVIGVRGPNGGFRLVRPAKETTLLEVFEAIEGPLPQKRCLLGKPRCDGESCVMGGLLHEIYEDTKKYFTNTTLADLRKVLIKEER